jgi:predicted ATPase
MLTRIYIDNFRCFVNFEYRPASKQLLIGANGSGKSSLLDAIRLLKQFLQGGENPFTQSMRTRWQDKPLQVFEIEAVLDRRKYEYRVEIRFASKTGQMSVSLETLKVSGTNAFEFVNGKISFFPNDSTQATTLPMETTGSALHFSKLSNSHVRRFVEWMESIHCFRIDAYPGQMDESADREERHPDDELGNLAGWYRYSQAHHPNKNVEFLSAMKKALDGFQALRFSNDEDGVQRLRADFTVHQRERVNYSLSELSDGQRCLLGLYMILHFLIAKGHTVFIDEPDNFVSLREIQPWLLAIESMVEDQKGQLILASHHPELLNYWAARHGLRFFREENGHVRTEQFKTDPNGDLQPSELVARGLEGE